MEQTIERLIQVLSHSGSLRIIQSLKNGSKRQKDLIEDTGLDKTIIWRRINELFNIGLIQVSFNTPTGSKTYSLTPLGKKIVQLIEEMEKEFEEYHKKQSNEDFINELLEDK